MLLSEWLDSLPRAGDALAAASSRDTNVTLLEDRLDRGYVPLLASLLPDGVGSWPGPCWHFVLERDGARESVTVWPGFRAVELFRSRLGEVPVALPDARPQRPSRAADSSMTDELREVFDDVAELGAEDKAAALMDWIMERTEASRCALVPFDGGTAGRPLAFHLRGRRQDAKSLRHVPRQILEYVARTRQPLISHDVEDPENVLPPEATVVHQKVSSYMAVPVVFRGSLLAVCYVDRFDRPRRFRRAEQRAFEAFAYELAMPLLSLLEERRRDEYRGLRDAILSGEREPSPTTSEAFEKLLASVRKLAPHPDENILLLGETGAGKEYVARMVHELSGRGGKPFVPINLSAIPSELFESELMGSVRGAYTSAVDRPGRLAEADGGTLFLDELGDLPLINQTKLLRFLEDKRLTPVGGRGDRQVEVRIIAATNRDLDDMIGRGDFREDLYHRFAPPLKVPPLRARREEIVPLARRFLELRAREKGIPAAELQPESEAFLLGYRWPGNVRQLQTLMSHALILADDGRIDVAVLRSLVSGDRAAAKEGEPPAGDWQTYRAWQDERERAWLVRELAVERDNAAATARRLGCPVTTFRSVLKRHGLP